MAKLRGLPFDHPVPVRYLPDAAFRKRVGTRESKLTKSDRRKIANLESTLRAFGLIDAGTDIVKSIDAVSGAGVLAYYDPQAKEVVIRGKGKLDVNRKATLAHELTHVLQDQHFDVLDLRRAAANSDTSSSSALTALIEGDAARIKDAYLKGLSAADRKAYDAAEAEEADSVASEIESAPELVKIEFSAPYVFGPMVLDVLTAHGGNRAVDDALERGVPTDKIYLDPAEALRDPKVTKVSTPAVPKGAKRLGMPDEIGAFDLYTLLSSRIDRQDALTAADAWTGDRYVTYRDGGRESARATIASKKAGATALTGALRAWARAMPAASVEAGPGARRVTVTSCDTGAIAAPTADRTEGAVRLLATRNAIFASGVRGARRTRSPRASLATSSRSRSSRAASTRTPSRRPKWSSRCRSSSARSRATAGPRVEPDRPDASGVRAPDAREQVAAVAHRVGDLAVVVDGEAHVAKELEVGRGVVVAPAHVQAEPAVRVVVLGQVARTEAEQRPPAGAEHAVDLAEDRRVE